MSLKPLGSRYGTCWGHWCLAGLGGLAALAGTKCLLNCRNTKLVSLNSVCTAGIKWKWRLERLSRASQSQLGLKVTNTDPSLPRSRSAVHTYSCASKDCYSCEEQQNNDCCRGQAHNRGSPEVEAASFLVPLCEETHFIHTKWSSMFECFLGALYLWLQRWFRCCFSWPASLICDAAIRSSTS